jgi:hypothetical protein
VPASEASLAAEILGRILSRGVTVSPYKFLLIVALLEALPELEVTRGELTALPLRHLSERCIRILWPQVLPYRGQALSNGSVAGDLAAVRWIAGVQEAEPSLSRFLTAGRWAEQRRQLTGDLAWLMAQWPVPRLQTVDGFTTNLLWPVPPEWRERTTGAQSRRPVPKSLFRVDASGLPCLEMYSGVAELLIRLTPLLRPLAELRWAEVVSDAHVLALPDADPLALLEHLFPPVSRSGATQQAAPLLRRAQEGRCFWCGRRIRGDGHVDHVIPWSRTHNDAIENLVLCDLGCNQAKSDWLPCPRLVGRYLDHLDSMAEHKVDAERAGLFSDQRSTRLGLRSAVLFGPSMQDCFEVLDGSPTVVRVDRQAWRAVAARLR